MQTVHDDIDALGDKPDSLEDENTKLKAELKRQSTHFRITVEGRTCDISTTFGGGVWGWGVGGVGGGGDTPNETWNDCETAVQNVIKNALVHHYQCRD